MAPCAAIAAVSELRSTVPVPVREPVFAIFIPFASIEISVPEISPLISARPAASMSTLPP